jgi:hypothetical protein
VREKRNFETKQPTSMGWRKRHEIIVDIGWYVGVLKCLISEFKRSETVLRVLYGLEIYRHVGYLWFRHRVKRVILLTD